MSNYVTKKKDMNFESLDSLKQVVNVVNEAAQALDDSKRTIRESAIPEVLAGAVGAGVGGTISFAALYGLGTVGLSGPGIMSGLAVAGASAKAGLAAIGVTTSASVAGVFVLAAPVAVLAAGGVGLASSLKNKQLKQEKERLYKEAVKKHQSIITALKKENTDNKERLDYLQGLNILLQKACTDLATDLGIA